MRLNKLVWARINPENDILQSHLDEIQNQYFCEITGLRYKPIFLTNKKNTEIDWRRFYDNLISQQPKEDLIDDIQDPFGFPRLRIASYESPNGVVTEFHIYGEDGLILIAGHNPTDLFQKATTLQLPLPSEIENKLIQISNNTTK